METGNIGIGNTFTLATLNKVVRTGPAAMEIRRDPQRAG